MVSRVVVPIMLSKAIFSAHCDLVSHCWNISAVTSVHVIATPCSNNDLGSVVVTCNKSDISVPIVVCVLQQRPWFPLLQQCSRIAQVMLFPSFLGKNATDLLKLLSEQCFGVNGMNWNSGSHGD
jgi:hypothetical protein